MSLFNTRPYRGQVGRIVQPAARTASCSTRKFGKRAPRSPLISANPAISTNRGADTKLLIVTAAIVAAIASAAPNLALARNQGSAFPSFARPSLPQTSYQPRVYNSPPPQYSRDAYVAGGTIIGGLAGGYRGGGPGATIGGALGGYYGGQRYDYQNRYTTQYSYYPPAFGIANTTPYYMRTVPRY
jgi:hypothetical protein